MDGVLDALDLAKRFPLARQDEGSPPCLMVVATPGLGRPGSSN